MDLYIADRIYSSNVSDSTAKKRIGVLRKLFATRFPNASSFEALNDLKTVKQWLESYPQVTQAVYAQHIRAAMKSHPEVILPKTLEELYKLQGDLYETKDNIRSNLKRSPKQEVSLAIPLSDIRDRYLKALDEFVVQHGLGRMSITKAAFDRQSKDSFMSRLQDLLIVGLYTLQPALRNDWAGMRVTNARVATDMHHNWLVIRGGKYLAILNDFKNVKALGPQEIEIDNPKLKGLIKLWLQCLKHLGAREYLLYYSFSADGRARHVSNDSLRSMLPKISKRTVDAELGINDYRHLSELEIQSSDRYVNGTPAERVAMHRQMLHGSRVARETYSI